MRILWVKANKLLPVHSGGDIRSYHIARHLASQHELVFLSYYDGARDTEYERQLEEHFPGAVCVCTERRDSKPARLLHYLAKLPSGEPYAVSRFRFARVQETIHSWFQQRRFDLAVCDFLDAATNFPAAFAVPCVLFQHNVESEIWRRRAATESNPAKRMVCGLEFKRILGYEKEAVRRFHHVISVSEHDRSLMSAWVDAARVTVVPTGVDLEQYSPAEDCGHHSAPVVMFVGAMDWEPNIDAVEYFCSEIWPTVLAKIPAAKFRIVGRNPDRRVENFASRSVEVTGRVPSVIKHLREAAVVVVPLRIGGGTRLKIYEAMAAGKAVVSTSVGAEGLDVHHDRDIVLADSPETFADSIVTLLQDVERRKQFERSAAEQAAGYSWREVGKKFEAVLARISGAGTPLPAEQFSAAAIQTADRPMA